MASDEFDKLIQRFLREAGAPGPEHQRLEEDLQSWAVLKNYSVKYTGFQSGAKPDVLRGTSNKKYVFCGDAKDSANETVDNNETVRRIRGYFDDFASLLGGNGFDGGFLAIATNCSGEATRWIPVLNTLAQAAGISGTGGTPPNFRLIKLEGKNTWITYW